VRRKGPQGKDEGRMMNDEKTLGSICAGIGGFDLGFEQAGWRTAWQIELDDVNRAVLADRFPDAKRYKDLRDWRSYSLSRVACVAFGFPCQDISVMGNLTHDKSRRGLAGGRSGLFFKIMEIVRHLQPTWLVIENVPALLHINEGRDIQAVIGALRECGYLGFGRVLNAQYFGIPQRRERLILVAGLGRYPTMDFMADAQPVECLPSAFGSGRWCAPADAWAGYTLTAPTKGSDARHGKTSSRFNMGSELFVAEENGWDQMFERQREVELYGLRTGLDATNLEQAYAAGNAFPPPMAKWIAEILNRS
jgi:DNA (cytosine-5)-methyltransferase 1